MRTQHEVLRVDSKRSDLSGLKGFHERGLGLGFGVLRPQRPTVLANFVLVHCQFDLGYEGVVSVTAKHKVG